MRRLFSNTTIDFVGVRRFAYALTAAFFLPGIILLLFRGLNYSIEFTGGTLVQIETAASVNQGAIRAALEAQGVHGAEIQSFGSAGEFVIRARTAKEGSDADDTGVTAAAVGHALDNVLGAGKYAIVRTEAVGPKVGGELRQRALFAIFLSFFAILAYLAYRFEWRFGAAAIVATAHDVIGTVIFVSLMQFEVSLMVVGGILSVLGLSLNETIIIFDRVRENEHRKLPGDLGSVLNHSINETLPRTVLTHGTTLSTMLTLIIFGGEVIRPFAMVMFWGVFTGIFSSMYIAPSVLLWIRHKWPTAGGAHVKTTASAPYAGRASRQEPAPVKPAATPTRPPRAR